MAFEAFKAGAFDLRVENSAKNWATRYIGKNFAKGYIVKDEHKNESAQDTRWLAFNIQRPVFPIVGCVKPLPRRLISNG